MYFTMDGVNYAVTSIDACYNIFMTLEMLLPSTDFRWPENTILCMIIS